MYVQLQPLLKVLIFPYLLFILIHINVANIICYQLMIFGI